MAGEQQGGAQPNAALPKLDMSTSVPLNQPLPKLDMSTSVPVGSATAASGAASSQPGAGMRAVNGVVSGVKDALVNPIEDAVAPPSTSTEALFHAIGGPGGLIAFRQAAKLMNAAEKLKTAMPAEYSDASKQFRSAVNDFHQGKYGQAALDAASGLGEAAPPFVLPIAGGQLHDLAESAKPGGDLAGTFARQATGGAINAGLAMLGDEGINPSEAEAFDATKAASKVRSNPFRDITQGADAAQTPAEQAVRRGVQASADKAGTASPFGVNQTISKAPILEGGNTVMDEPLQRMAEQEKQLYKNIDDTAGFDLKELKSKIKNDQYNLKQLGNTPEDLQKSLQLKQTIADAQDRVLDAEKALAKKGIDPKSGDALHMARQAGNDFQKVLVRNTAADGTINVDKLIEQSKQLRWAKRGDRLAQFMGEDGADQYIKELQAAQAAGVHAMKVQKIAKWVGGLVLGGATAAAGAEVGGHAVSKGLSLLAE